MKATDYQGACIDYLNGHMSDSNIQEFEKELEANDDLANALSEASHWKLHIQSGQRVETMPNFTTFKTKITKSTWQWQWGFSIAVASSFIFLVYFGSGSQQHVVNNTFETLTSPAENYTQAIAHIALAKNVNVDKFIADYDLKKVKIVVNTKIIVVEQTPSFKKNYRLINADKRSLYVKQIDKSE